MEISKEDFLAICPALIQQATQGCRHAEEDDYVIGHELPSDIESNYYIENTNSSRKKFVSNKFITNTYMFLQNKNIYLLQNMNIWFL